MSLPGRCTLVGKKPLALIFFIGLSFTIGLANSCNAAVLQDMDLVATDQSTEVILNFDEKIQYKYQYLPKSPPLPARCYVDFYNTGLSDSLPSHLQVDDQRVSNIRTGSYATKLRVVLDLKNVKSCAASTSSTAPFQVRITVPVLNPPEIQPDVSTRQESAGLDSAASANDFTEGETWRVGTTSPVEENTELAGASIKAGAALAGFTPSGRAGLSTWGWIQLFSATDLQKDLGEDHSLSRLLGRLGVDWNKQLQAGSSMKFVGTIEVDRFFYDSELAEEDTQFRLHETYFQYNRPTWDLALGKQRIRWGKSDQLSPVDRINPQDFRQFITLDLEERSLPSWLVRGRWFGEAIRLETIVQPWFQDSKLEYFDSDWALYRNLRQAILASSDLPAEVKDYIRNLRTSDKEPAKTPENMSAAVRVSWQTKGTDFALSYQYGWETLPTIVSFPVKNISFSGDPNVDPAQFLTTAILADENVQAEYRRQQTFGFEWETVLDPIGFRGELALIDEVAFLTRDLTSERRPVSHLVSGVDYISANEWYFNFQGSWHYIEDYTEDILYFEENTVSLLGEISKSLWRGNVELALQYNYTLTDQSSYIHPSLTLKYFRRLECELGANLFSGDSDTLFGSYGHADQVYARAKYSF